MIEMKNRGGTMEDYQYEKVKHHAQIPAMIAVLDHSQINDYFPSNVFIPSHWHRSLEISLIEHATVSLRCGEKESIIENDFTCINSGVVHSLNAILIQDNASCIILLISYDFLKQYVPEIDDITFNLSLQKDHSQLKQLYYNLRHLYLQQDNYSYLLITACILELVKHLLAFYQVTKYQIKSKSFRNQDQIKEVLTYMHTHYQEDMSLQDIATFFHVSKEYFSRQFHHFIGKTFHDYLTGYRLYKAYDDVVNSDMTIQDIARKHGFLNVRSFIHIFTKTYHETPLQYRKNVNNLI